jgi:L-fuculose-phosphate aldolase
MSIITTEAHLRAEIVTVGKRLYERGLIVAGDGNISARLSDDTILITPAGMAKHELTPDDLVVVTLEGVLLRGQAGRRPSSEQLIHLAVYQQRPEIMACVHAHPPTAVAATLAGVSMEVPLLPEAILALGPVPTAPYARTGTAALSDAIRPYIADHTAMLLAYHGALTYGASPRAAFELMEQIEHCAKMLLAAHQFGGAQPLPQAQINEIIALRMAHQKGIT